MTLSLTEIFEDVNTKYQKQKEKEREWKGDIVRANPKLFFK